MLRTRVDFSAKLRPWDGFGVNYVEACQTRDYDADPQEYGGFSILSEEDRRTVMDMVFGPEGLEPGIIKMFLDPFHQEAPADGHDFSSDVCDLSAYDHERTTKWMRYFASEGHRRVRERGRDLEVIVTLYGPPAWQTTQGFVRGRDLDPGHRLECAKYMISWAKYLREVEGLPVKYISFHNEGESWMRWPPDGSGPGSDDHDYNMYWPPEQVCEFLRFMPRVLEANGMGDVGLTPGETTNWYRFSEWGYADAIADDEEALLNLGLVTSHGFYDTGRGRWFGDWRSLGADILRDKRPELHSWVTSTSWKNMDVEFVNEIRNSIYSAKVNAIIPWAAVQRPPKWVGGDPNPGCAFRVGEDGSFEVLPGYHYFKQVSRAGRRGTSVCRILSNDSEIGLIGFAGDGDGASDAVVVLNLSKEGKSIDLQVAGARGGIFEGFRTSPDEEYASVGSFDASGGAIRCELPPRSVTTFFCRS